MSLYAAVHPMLLGISALDPQYLLDHLGGSLFWISLVIIFIECGLFFPFLPGDTLLFALGLFIAGKEGSNIHVLSMSNHLLELVAAIALLSVAAVLGNITGYEIGTKIGPPMYRHDGRILKRKYLDNTKVFFDRHGDKALIIGRFVPFVRTYITLVAGVTGLDRRRFLVSSVIGAVAWVTTITLLGYFVGGVKVIQDNLDAAMLALGLFTVVPLIIETVRHSRQQHTDSGADADAEAEAGSHPEPAVAPERTQTP